jgi:hypothetical protein
MRNDLDQPVALYRADERRPAPRVLTLGIRDTRIEVRGRFPQSGRKLNPAAGAPLSNLITAELAADSNENAP